MPRDERGCPKPELFDAALITEAEIDAFCPAQVRGKAPDQNVVFGGHGALDAASRGRGIFTDTQTFFGGELKKCIAHHHSQTSFARQVADSFGKRDHFAQPRPATERLRQRRCRHEKKARAESRRSGSEDLKNVLRLQAEGDRGLP